MRNILLVFLYLIFLTIGIFSILRMNAYWIIIETILMLSINIFLLKNEWKVLYKLIKNGIILFSIFCVIFAVISLINKDITFFVFAQFIAVGIISVTILMPAITDSFALVTYKIKIIRYFFESFILIRNFIIGLSDDFSLGLLTAPKYKNSNIGKRLRFLGLASFTLVSRTPDIITNLLIATTLSKFDVKNIKKILKPSTNLFISFFLLMIFFIIHLITVYA